jgi:ribonuclease BN (tRNA processing enzyme)
MKLLIFLLTPLMMFASSISLQILGSGGPEFSKRASSSYIIWVDSKAKVLVDAGGGAFLRFSESGAKIEDLSFMALTHLHIDHSADLPAFMKAGYFSKRSKALPLLGTVGAGDFPDIKTFTERLFGKHGAYAYMQDILTTNSDSFELNPMLFDQGFNSYTFGNIVVGMVGVQHGEIPAIAYCITVEGKKIVFAGDTSASSEKLIDLAHSADYLIVHHAIPQHAGNYAKYLHITPKRIGQVAQKAGVKHLILSHRMKRTYNVEEESMKLIRESYIGDVIWAEDLMKIEVK